MNLANPIRLYAATGIFVLLAAASTAQPFTFTPGPPPIGDGEQYPRYLPVPRQVAIGADPAEYSTGIDLEFFNASGNLAFFDSNNLLTRPSTLIQGEAFWTDIKSGTYIGINGQPFQTDSLGFFLFNDFTDLGFDLAIASVSDNLPTVLEFDMEDGSGNRISGDLQLVPGSGNEPLFIEPDDFGTFTTLASPRTAYEARYRINVFDLQDNIVSNDPSEAFDAADIVSFAIDFEDIATLGGTTQVAIDNVVVDGSALPNDPRIDPLTFRPLEPVGSNKPQYFDIKRKENATEAFPDAPDIDVTSLDLIDVGFEVFDAIAIELNALVDLPNPSPNPTLTIPEVSVHLPPESPVLAPPAPEVDVNTGLVFDASAQDDPRNTFVVYTAEVNEDGVGPIIRIDSSQPVDAGQTPINQFFLEIEVQSEGGFGAVRTSGQDGVAGASNEFADILGFRLEDLADGETQLVPRATANALGEEIARQVIEGWDNADLPETPGVIPPIYASRAATSSGAVQAEVGMFSVFLATQFADLEASDPIQINEEVVLDYADFFINEIATFYFESLQNDVAPGTALTPEQYRTIERVRARIQELNENDPSLLLAPGLTSDAADATEPTYYLNTSLEQYLILKATAGELPVTGDSGSYLTPVFGDSGNALEFVTNTWLITDDYGAYGVLLASTGIASLIGDFDQSGQVEQGDLNLVLNNWGETRAFEDGASTFTTGLVDQEELNAVLNNWGASAAPNFAQFDLPGVPEPGAGLVLLGLPLLGFLGRRP